MQYIEQRMKTLALVVAVAVGLASFPAEAAPKERGFLTGLGLGFLVGGLAGVGVGVAGSLNASFASIYLVSYPTPPNQDHAPTIANLRNQQLSGQVMTGVGFALGGALIIASIICLIIDTPPPVAVTFVPTSQGGTFALSANF